MAGSALRILKRQALDGRHPGISGEIIGLLEGTASGGTGTRRRPSGAAGGPTGGDAGGCGKRPLAGRGRGPSARSGGGHHGPPNGNVSAT